MNSLRKLLILAASANVVLCYHTGAQTDPAGGAQSQDSSSVRNEYAWHLELSPYLWFAGSHGTVGALGHNTSVHASPGDLLSHLDIGLMGAAEARYGPFLLTGDMIWSRVSDSQALPFAGLGATSADVRVGQFIWTSKVGYRVMDRPKIKVDANVGARYWHEGQKLNFNPSTSGLNFDGSQSWTDVVVGGRIQLPVGEKMVIDALGDVGGWDSTAKLDYQFAALLGYKICPKTTLLAGYRYLFVDYRPSNRAVYTTVTSGAILGATFKFK